MTVIGEAESGHKHYGQAEGGKTTKATGQSISGNGSLGSLGSFDPWFLSSSLKNNHNKNPKIKRPRMYLFIQICEIQFRSFEAKNIFLYILLYFVK